MGGQADTCYIITKVFEAHCSLCELRSIDNLCFPKLTSDTMADLNELACTYAALILTDDEVPITGGKIASILKAASVDSSVGAAPAAGGVAAAPAGGAAATAEAPKEEKKEEKKDESEDSEDDDMGFGLSD